jgi:hypothetical protein
MVDKEKEVILLEIQDLIINLQAILVPKPKEKE